jgi:hypothetical protein
VLVPEARSKTFRKLGPRSGITSLDTHELGHPLVFDPGHPRRAALPGTTDPGPLALTRRLDLGHPCARVSVGGTAILVGFEPVHSGSRTKAARHLSFLDTHTFRSWTPKAFVPGHPPVSARPSGSGIWSRAQPTPPNPASCGRPNVGAALWWVSRIPMEIAVQKSPRNRHPWVSRSRPRGCPEVAWVSRSRQVRKSPRGCPEVGALAMGWKMVSGQGIPVCFECAWSAAANAGDEPSDRDADGPAEATCRLEIVMIQSVAGRFSSESWIWGSGPGTLSGAPSNFWISGSCA